MAQIGHSGIHQKSKRSEKLISKIKYYCIPESSLPNIIYFHQFL
ncbi:hypothetical protein ACTFIV_005754 [Dictyostelium citrinum]